MSCFRTFHKQNKYWEICFHNVLQIGDFRTKHHLLVKSYKCVNCPWMGWFIVGSGITSAAVRTENSAALKKKKNASSCVGSGQNYTVVYNTTVWDRILQLWNSHSNNYFTCRLDCPEVNIMLTGSLIAECLKRIPHNNAAKNSARLNFSTCRRLYCSKWEGCIFSRSANVGLNTAKRV